MSNSLERGLEPACVVKRGTNQLVKFAGTGTGTGLCCKTWDERTLVQSHYRMSVALERELERVCVVKHGTARELERVCVVKRGAKQPFQFTGTGTGTGLCCKTWDERTLFQFPDRMSVILERELERVCVVKHGARRELERWNGLAL